MPRSSSRLASAPPSGDALPSPDPVVVAAEQARPLFIVATAEAEARLLAWGLPALLAPPTLDALDGAAFRSTNPVFLPEAGVSGRWWAERLATPLVQAGVTAKVLALDGGAAAWIGGTGTPEALARLETIAPRFEPSRTKAPRDADWMVAFAQEKAAFFCTPTRETFARFDLGGARRTARVGSLDFQDYLASAFHEAFGRFPREDAFGAAKQALGTYARLFGTPAEVFTRVGQDAEGSLYLDLCNGAGEAVRIHRGEHRWEVVRDVPVLFQRPATASALPHPAARTGSSEALASEGLRRLRRYVHLGSDEDALLLWGFLVFALRPGGPCPALALVGGQGTGKSVTTEILRSVVDPVHGGGLGSLPRTERDLAITTCNVYLLAFDNVSHLTAHQSDALCRLSTRFEHRERRLTTDDEEVVFTAVRPFLLTSIVDVVERDELASRTFTLHLQRPPRLVDPSDLFAAFRDDLPTILAGLLECAWVCLLMASREPAPGTTRLKAFEQWSLCAARLVGGEDGRAAMEHALRDNQRAALVDAASADPLLRLVLDFATERGPWTGTMTELHDALVARLPSPERPSSFAPRALSQALGLKEPSMHVLGLTLDDLGHQGPRHERRRLYTLSAESLSDSSSL